MKENLEKNMFALAGSVSTIIFWYCAFTGTGSDVSQILIVVHATVCYALAFFRKNGKYKNIKDIKLKSLEVGTSGVKIEMQGKEEMIDEQEA